MKYSRQVWDQVKNKTSLDFIRALNKQLGGPDIVTGSEYIYRFPDKRRISIHRHKKSYGPNLQKTLLSKIGWTEEEMKEFKFI